MPIKLKNINPIFTQNPPTLELEFFESLSKHQKANLNCFANGGVIVKPTTQCKNIVKLDNLSFVSLMFLSLFLMVQTYSLNYTTSDKISTLFFNLRVDPLNAVPIIATFLYGRRLCQDAQF
jgi:hypothetical protein